MNSLYEVKIGNKVTTRTQKSVANVNPAIGDLYPSHVESCSLRHLQFDRSWTRIILNYHIRFDVCWFQWHRRTPYTPNIAFA